MVSRHGPGKSLSWTILRYHPGIQSERLRISTRNLKLG